MEYRNFDVTLVSAHGLKDINLVGKMDLYAVAYISGLPVTKQKTKVHDNCGTTPRWNHKMKFTLDERSLVSPPAGGLFLVVQIMAEKFGADKDIGEVRLDILELFKDGGVEVEKMVDYKIGGRGKGTLSVSYKFGEKHMQDGYDVKSSSKDQTPVGYPPSNGGYGQAPVGYPPSNGGYGQTGSGMPPQQDAYPMDKGYGMGGAPPAGYPPTGGYGMGGPPPSGYPPSGYPAYGNPSYGAPPPQGYGAPPPQGYGGYYPPPQGGYAPPPQQPHGYGGYNQQSTHKKKKKGGMMGMGLGLGAGLLGGMLIGDMVGEVGEAAAYADGYEDAMGGDAFDF